MPHDNWEKVQEIFLLAADLPRADQAGFLDAACLGDAALRKDVESLLRADRTGDTLMSSAIQSEASSLLEGSQIIGSRLGAYRVIREIGRGGMGTVFLAERDDDQFRKQVAIKVVRRGMDTAHVLGRFRHERQILANLDHPYIARLIDGGTTPDGRPFFVMEHVEGKPIDVYCRELDLESRLRLFLRVCEAVSYAHRGLVVHRDLKPGNILVMKDAIPKLLDFGVAKLLTPDVERAYTATVLGMGPLTPEFASPEQVRGQTVTTATDVYSLGAILYELLSGSRAQPIKTRTPLEIERVVCQTEAPPPSTTVEDAALRRRLDGELDNIVMMAMRKEKERRYQSVDQFAADIRNYLQGHPVIARQDSLTYRASKFIRRNRLAIAAAALAVTGLLTGAGLAVSEARNANAARLVAEAQRQTAERERVRAELARQSEEQQHKAADHEMARAEAEALAARMERVRSDRRLTQMAELADRTLYDVHSSIERLPGAIEARRRIVATTLQFLEKLSKDAGSDDRVQAVLSAAYRKVGDVQGYPMRPNLGDSAGALANYQKARQLMDPLLSREPNNPEYLVQKLSAEIRTAQLLSWMGQRKGAEAIYRSALPTAQRLARLNPKDLESRMQETAIYGGMASTLSNNDTADGLANARKQVAALEQVARDFPDSDEAKLELAAAYSQEAGFWNSHGELREASDRYRRSIALREAFVASKPSDVLARRGLMISYGNLAGSLGSPFFPNLGDREGARLYYGKALAIARGLAAGDKTDRLAQYDLAQVLLRSATLEIRPSSLEPLREAEGILAKLVADSKSISTMRTLAWVQESIGRVRLESGQRAEAVTEFRKSISMMEKCLAIDSTDMSSIRQMLEDEEGLATALAQQGDRSESLEMAWKAVRRAEQVAGPTTEHERLAVYVAKAYLSLANVQKILGSWTDVRTSAEKALAGWRGLIAEGSKRFDQADVNRAETLLAECNARAK